MSTSIISYEELESSDERGFQPNSFNSTGIPLDLLDRRQWVVWKKGEQREDGRHKKIPYDPNSGTRRAKSNDPATWGTYEQARTAYIRGNYDGLGFMLLAMDPFTVIDYDHCRDPQTGEITSEAMALVAQFDSYTEKSPSGTGLHIFIRATPREIRNKTKPVEVYTANHLITVTGQRLPSSPATVEPRQDVFDVWYRGKFPSNPTPQQQVATSPVTTDKAIISLAKKAMNGAKFTRLWEGMWEGDYESQSDADQALVTLLAFYTQDEEQLDGLFRQSGLYREKWERGDYVRRTIKKALESVTKTYRPRKRESRRITHIHEWQRRTETPEEREYYLRQQAEDAKERVLAHIVANNETPLVIALSPGVGKTTSVASITERLDIAWIAQRHDMYTDVAKHAPDIRHIQPCTEENCPDATLLNTLASMGYNVYPMHRRHNCDYYHQHEGTGNAFYQVRHVPTSFPKRHQAVIVDELDVLSWLDDHTITRREVEQAREHELWRNPYYAAAGELLRALSEAMLDAIRAKTALYGKSLYDILDQHSGGRLRELLAKVEGLDVAVERAPIASDADIQTALARGRAILPSIVQAFQEDLPKWTKGDRWNSRVHLDRKGTLHIIRLLRFQDNGSPQPLVILDATANSEIHSRLLGCDTQIMRQEVTPPPHTRHIAVRVRRNDGGVKRYNRYSLVEAPNVLENRDRAIRELQHILNSVNPDGQRRVGLITYKGTEDAIGMALDIPEDKRGHFW